MKLKITTAVFILSLFFSLSTFALAEDEATRSVKPRPFATFSSELKEKAKDRLEEGKLRMCEARQDAIKGRMASLLKMAINMEEKFGAIAGRVEEYYNSKLVPQGKTVPNYNALVADIQAKKNAVDAALAKAQTDSTFDCTGDNPKGAYKTFREDMRSVKKALADYRKSIKNLIVAVRGVAGEVETPEPTPTPTATPTPTPTPTP